MSFYRTVLAAVAAIAIASPVFAQSSMSAPAAPSDMGSAPAATSNQNGSSMTAPSSSDQSSAAMESKVNLNKATAKELMKVKGINASKARALIACRKKQKGHTFSAVEDIAKCKGFTKMKDEEIKKIEDQLTAE